MKRKTKGKAQPVTQSYKLYALLSKKSRTRDQIAKTLQVNPVSVGGYVLDIKRIYGAKVEYNRDKRIYALKNRVKVPRTGVREMNRVR